MISGYLSCLRSQPSTYPSTYTTSSYGAQNEGKFNFQEVMGKDLNFTYIQKAKINKSEIAFNISSEPLRKRTVFTFYSNHAPSYPCTYDQIKDSSDHLLHQHKRIDSQAKHFHFIVTEEQNLDKFIDVFFEMNSLGKRSKKQLYISAQHVIQNPEIPGLEFRNRDFFENGGCKSLSNQVVENCEYFHGPLARFKK